MRIVQINISNYGSTGNIMKRIHHTAMDSGFESWYFYGKGTRSSDVRINKFSTKYEYFTHVIKTILFDMSGFGSKRDTKRLIRSIETIKPDIVHLHNIHSMLLNFEILFDYIKNNNIELIWTLHDSWAFTAFCGNPEMFGCNRWKSECNHCPQRKHKQYLLKRGLLVDYSKHAFRRKKKAIQNLKAIRIICPSEWIMNNAKNSLLKNSNILLLNNGIDLDVFSPITDMNILESRRNELCIPKNGNVFLGVASVWPESKGLNSFVKMSKLIKEEDRIILVGLSDKQIKNLPKNIIGLKRTNSKEDLVVLYSLADVFVNPTLADTYPTVNMESIACGTPVVTYRTNGSPELVGQDCGFVVEQYDVQELYSKSIEAIKICKQEDCVKYARERFDINMFLEKQIEIYKGVDGYDESPFYD